LALEKKLVTKFADVGIINRGLVEPPLFLVRQSPGVLGVKPVARDQTFATIPAGPASGDYELNMS
jgi:hypothetical protein